MPPSAPARNASPPVGSDAAVAFEQVGVNVGGLRILENVSARLPRGGCSAVVGPNGAGKTTLLLALLGHLPYTGRIHIGETAEGRAPRIGYVPQRLPLDPGLPVTVEEFLALGRQRRPLWLGLVPRLRDPARQALAEVGGAALAQRRLGTLSGGEIQRVLLALALLQDPELLLLDEPAAGVDVRGGQLFCELLERLRTARRFTQVMVSHDLATVTHHATHVVLLNRSVVAEGAPRAVLTPAHLAAVFGLHMGLVDARALPAGQASCTCVRCEEVGRA